MDAEAQLGIFRDIQECEDALLKQLNKIGINQEWRVDSIRFMTKGDDTFTRIHISHKKEQQWSNLVDIDIRADDDGLHVDYKFYKPGTSPLDMEIVQAAMKQSIHKRISGWSYHEQVRD